MSTSLFCFFSSTDHYYLLPFAAADIAAYAPQASYHPAAPQPAATGPPGGRVHYPPQTFTTVPLRDDSPSGRASPSPLASGRNTPSNSANKKKSWTFLPTHSSTSLESGQAGGLNEKSGKRPKNARGSSWDLLGERAEWEDYNPKNANVENLRFAQGDVGTTKVSCRQISP